MNRIILISLIGLLHLSFGQQLNSKFENFEKKVLEYESWHKQQIESCSREHKFILFKTRENGLGNRLRNFASAFISAIIMNRVLLVDWVKPYFLSKYIVKRIDWYLEEYNLRCGTLNLQKYFMYETFMDPKNIEIFKEDFKKYHSNTDIVIFHHTGSFINYIQESEISKYLLNGLTEEDIQYYFYNKYFSFQPWIQQTINKTLSQFSSKLTIGLQMRLGTKTTPFPLKMVKSLNKHSKRFWFGDGPYPNDPSSVVLKQSSPYAEEYFFHCAEKILNEVPNSKVFMASDRPEAIENAKKLFGDSLILVSGKPIHSGNTNNNNIITEEGIVKVLVEWYLIGETDFLYTTQYSSFGKSAAIRGAIYDIRNILPENYNEKCPLIIINDNYVK